MRGRKLVIVRVAMILAHICLQSLESRRREHAPRLAASIMYFCKDTELKQDRVFVVWPHSPDTHDAGQRPCCVEGLAL